MALESPTKVIIAPPPEPIVTSPPQVDPHPLRLNPVTLAAIQTAVAQAPVAQPTAPSALLPIATMTEESDRRNLRAPATLPDAESGDRTERNTRPVNGVETERYRAALVAPTAVVTVPASAPHASAPPVTPPPATTEPSPDHPDNLAMIRGVGEAYKRRLYGVGIYTWRQVAESDIETLRRITRAKPNADINGWRTQARELAEKYQRWQTTFRGPLDDFTRIDGIGAITADLLYKAGICTYDQLAGALPDELANIVPAPTVGDENDFAGWIKEAGRLANVKRRNEGLLA
jgi:predicted flap endonuclease-1-like 5' DNA nuclease